MKRLLLALLLGGCAASAPVARPRPAAAPASARAPVTSEKRREEAAALFDAATHNDKLRLKLLVDWSRYRLLTAWLRAHADHEVSTAELSLIEAQPDASEEYIEHAVGELQAQLAEAAKGPMPPQPRLGVTNALLAELRGGPPQTKYPALPRLWELTNEAVGGAEELTCEGARRVTLLFVGDRLAGVLEAR